MKISIVTPCKNSVRFIEQTIQSVCNQSTSGVVQYVIMDGGSTDGTLEILKKHEGHLQYVTGKDKCQSDAIQKGWQRCDGDLFAWINADDYYEPGAFEHVKLAAEKHPEALWFAGYYRMVDATGQEIRRVHAAYKHFLMRHYSYPLLLAENVIAQPSVFIRKQALDRIGSLDTESPDRMAFDYDLWMRLGKLGDPVIIKHVLSNFRWYPESITGSTPTALFRHELNYALRERQTHPISALVHRLNFIKIRLFYSLARW